MHRARSGHLRAMGRLCVLVLVVSGCAAPLQLAPLISRAKENEIAAASEARGYAFSARGVVTDMGFYRSSHIETETESVAVPVGKAKVSSSRSSSSEVPNETPYADIITPEGIHVRCWFTWGKMAASLRKGSETNLAGWFSSLRAEGDSFHVSLSDCRPPEYR